MGILPGVNRVMAAPLHWPYGHNQARANVPAVSCIIHFAMVRVPDGCDLVAMVWQQFDLQIVMIHLQDAKWKMLVILKVRSVSKSVSNHIKNQLSKNQLDSDTIKLKYSGDNNRRTLSVSVWMRLELQKLID